jgi:polysaccharide export outer membrane protein
MRITRFAGIGFVLLLAATSLWAAPQKKGSPHPPDPIAKIVASGVNKINIKQIQGQPRLSQRDPRYQLNVGDVLAIQFPFTPKFNQKVTVQPDGFVSLKDVGDIHVEGDTLPQLRKTLYTDYSKTLRKPEISVTLKKFEKPFFVALGQVTHPGKYDLRGGITVAAGVSMAGGFTREAKDSQVLLFHRVSENWVSVTKVNLKRMLSARNLAEDPELHPGDMIYVPSSILSKISRFIPFPTLGYSLYRTPVP